MSDDRLLVLGRAAVQRLLVFAEVVAVVREVYEAVAAAEARLFPLVREPLDGALFGLRSGFWPSRNLLGFKSSGYFPANSARGEANHQAAIVLLSPTTGRVLAFLDGNEITRARTAAAGAIGSALLARADARSVLVIGNGQQAEAQVLSHSHLLADRDPDFSVFAPRDDRSASKAQAFARRLAAQGIQVRVRPTLAAAVGEADIIVTATPSREPLLSAEDVAPGTHITAVGSDSAGKREVDPRLLLASHVIVDDPEQSRRYGESQGLDALGVLATIGNVLRERAPGRSNDLEITIFDSTGIGLHDVATARLAYDRAVAAGAGNWITLA